MERLRSNSTCTSPVHIRHAPATTGSTVTTHASPTCTRTVLTPPTQPLPATSAAGELLPGCCALLSQQVCPSEVLFKEPKPASTTNPHTQTHARPKHNTLTTHREVRMSTSRSPRLQQHRQPWHHTDCLHHTLMIHAQTEHAHRQTPGPIQPQQ